MTAFRSRLILSCQALVCSLMLTATVSVAAKTDETLAFDIAAQPLVLALKAFAEQANMQLLYKHEAVEGASANAVVGSFEKRNALERLLQGTGLEVVFTAEDAATIRPKAGDRVIRTSGPSEPVALRLAEVERAGAQLPPDDSRTREPQAEIVVTGTHIRGKAPVGSSLTVYTREDILASGAATLDQFARQIPQNFASVDALQGGAGNAGGLSQGGENRNRGAGINLLGIGPAATLTLVDGHRLPSSGGFGEFVDISLIPLAAVERVEVLTDGASALYGADAIAGVVNIILRKDFEGAEGSVHYDTTTRGGGEHWGGSLLFGNSWDGGNAMLTYEYDNQEGLDAEERGFIPPQSGPRLVSPKQHRNSVGLKAHQRLPGAVSMMVDAYYSERSFIGADTLLGTPTFTEGSGQQYGGGLGLSRGIGGDWHADFTATASRLKQPSDTDTPSSQTRSILELDMELKSARLLASGSLFALGPQRLKAAVGAEYRDERREARDVSIFMGGPPQEAVETRSRDVSSVFAELLIPLIGEANAFPVARRLEVSIAGRHDRYGDVGSSTNPKYGIVWSPAQGLDLRASYGTAFRAPSPTQLTDLPVYILFPLPNPASPPTTNTLLILGNGSPELKPETSTSLSAGFDFSPASILGLRFGATYFDIEFKDRITLPPIVGGNVFDVWSQIDTLAPFVDTSPDPARIAAIFQGTRPLINPFNIAPADVAAIFDDRIQNIAITRESGIEGMVGYTREGTRDTYGLSLTATHILKTEFQPAITVPPVVLDGKVGQPVDLKIRSTFSWSRGGLGSSLTLAYASDYSNPLVIPTQKIDSWITADLQLSYRMENRIDPAWLQGTAVALTIRNLTDETPPFIMSNDPASLGYDGGNADPFGRVISLRLTKSW